MNKKIIQFGPGRTGTTLIWQMLKYIFGNVEKCHGLNIGDYNVITYRDFRDSYLSVLRVNNSGISIKSMDQHYPFYSTQLRVLEEYDLMNKKLNNCLFLKYELFYNDYNYVYDKFEKYFNILLSEEKRKEITKYVSLETNIERSKKLGSFKRYDPNTHIHGEHIHHPEPGIWKEILNIEEQEHITSMYLRFLKKWGYK